MIPFLQSGVVTGGWSYIYAAYGITWATLALYGGWLWWSSTKEGA